MTKANILKRFFKKFYDLDLKGMTVTQVIKEFYKSKYDFDSKANSFVSAISEAIENNLAPGDGGSGGDMVVHCEMDTDTGRITLFKTWQEMHDAYNNVEMIIVVDSMDGPLEVESITTRQRPESGEMAYIVLTNHNTTYYVAQSPTDRPWRMNEK